MGIIGWGNASDAIEILSIGFVLPHARNELDLEVSQDALLSSIMFLGKKSNSI